MLGRLVETGLEFAAEGWEPTVAARVGMEHGVAAIVVALDRVRAVGGRRSCRVPQSAVAVLLFHHWRGRIVRRHSGFWETMEGTR